MKPNWLAAVKNLVRRLGLAPCQVVQGSQVEPVAPEVERFPVLVRPRRPSADPRRSPGPATQIGSPQRRAREQAGVEVLERPAVALEQVVGGRTRRRRPVRVAELLREHVAHVVVRRGQAPRVVLPCARSGCTSPGRAPPTPWALMPGPCRSICCDDLRVVVAELRAHHGQRVAGGRALGRDDQEVRRLLARRAPQRRRRRRGRPTPGGRIAAALDRARRRATTEPASTVAAR